MKHTCSYWAELFGQKLMIFFMLGIIMGGIIPNWFTENTKIIFISSILGGIVLTYLEYKIHIKPKEDSK